MDFIRSISDLYSFYVEFEYSGYDADKNKIPNAFIGL